MATLSNTDIFEYCLNHYDLPEPLSGRLRLYTQCIELCHVRPDKLYSDIKELVSELSAIAGKPLTHAIWLAEKEAVEVLYDGTQDNMSCYQTSETILSDLGTDGILFAYDKLPQPISES